MQAIESPHPCLRPWVESDFPAYVLLHADPNVVEYLGGVTRTRQEMRDAFNRLCDGIVERGWGVWAVINERGDIVGAAGLQPVRQGLPPHPAIAAACCLASTANSKGQVVRPMRVVLPWAFDALGLDEIVGFTALTNITPQAVLRRLGFMHDPARDFDHPELAPGHPLRRHVLYAIDRAHLGTMH